MDFNEINDGAKRDFDAIVSAAGLATACTDEGPEIFQAEVATFKYPGL